MLQLSGLYVRSTLLHEGWQLVYRSQSVEEERSAHQAESGRSSDTQQRRNVAGGTGSAESDVERLGRILQLRHAAAGVSGVDYHVYDCVRHFLRRRHKVPSRGTTRFPYRAVFGELGVFRLRRSCLGASFVSLR